MRTYDETAARVLARRDEYLAAKRARAATARRAAGPAVCAALVVAAGLGIWSAGRTGGAESGPAASTEVNMLYVPSSGAPTPAPDRSRGSGDPETPIGTAGAAGSAIPERGDPETFTPARPPEQGVAVPASPTPNLPAAVSAAPTEDVPAADPSERPGLPTVGDVTGEAVMGGVSIPAFVAFDGAVYGPGGRETGAEQPIKFAGSVYFNGDCSYDAYILLDYTDTGVRAVEDTVGIVINGVFQTYTKLFDLTFELDGTEYAVDWEYFLGNGIPEKVLLETEDYTVYETEDGGVAVNAAPMLRRMMPSLFDDGDGLHAEFWWSASARNAVETGA